MKAPAADPVPYWWFHGEVEAGGRAFLNNPQNGYQTANAPAGTPGTQGKSLAKYYEYSDNKPGPFSNIDISAGTRDGLYQFDLGGKNIGYDDQKYYFDFSKAGEHYLSAGWDQSPHVYSQSALTPFVINGNTVSLNGCSTGKTTAAALATCATPTDIGIKRDTGSVAYRWTPTDAWDIKTEYSHLARTGTQVAGSDATGITMQYPKPVDDTTQNYGLTGEYVGVSPWGKRFSFKAGYQGSTFTENVGTLTVLGTGANRDIVSTWPSNQANGFVSTLAADLPWKSRFVTTNNYTQMTQNATFDPLVRGTGPAGYTSLDGQIGTFLSNNVLTSKLTDDLTSKLTYRYYDFDNQTPETLWTGVQGAAPASTTGNSIAIGYTKQNAGADLNWRPTKEWNLGAAYGFERYDWTRADVNVTNENTGKVYADWKPQSWIGFRSSVLYGSRTFDNYNYLANVGTFQWPTAGSNQYSITYRQLMIDDRDTWKANFSTDVVVVQGLTLTPTVQYVDQQYGVDPISQQGLKDSKKWATGIDATYAINRDASVMVGYMYERGSQLLYGIDCTNAGVGANCTGAQTLTNDTSTVHTVTASLRYAAIPDKLDTELRYTASFGTDAMRLYVAGADPTGGQYPDNHTTFQRVDAIATYTFDKEAVAKLGWNGNLKAKLHYAWESNTADNWANDPLTPYTNIANENTTLWLAWNNPNYNVHMLMASLVASW